MPAWIMTNEQRDALVRAILGDYLALPRGLCGDRAEHAAHIHDSATLGTFWCTADPDDREPGRSERRRQQM